jgi:hypothetical protein
MIGRPCTFALAALATIVSGPAQAAPQVADVHGWKVVRADRSCGMSRDFPASAGGAPTGLMILAEHRGSTTHVVLTSADWSAETGNATVINYQLGDFLYRMPSVGLRTAGLSGYEAEVSENFLYDLAYADNLTVSKDGMVMSNMDLHGGYAAIIAFRECIATMRAQQID